jgi:F-type H+-transporting ATPase subunit delta
LRYQWRNKGLFHLLFENKRFEILTIAVEYSKLFDMNGVEVAQVTTAIQWMQQKHKFS